MHKKRYTMSLGSLFIFGSKKSKVKVTSHNRSVLVFTKNEILPLATYVSHADFSRLQCPAAQAMLPTPGFPCVTFPQPLPLPLPRDINHARHTDRGFYLSWSFLQSASGKSVAGVGLCTLVNAGF